MESLKRKKIAERITNLLFYFSILIFLVAFNFQDTRTGGWVQQFIPNTNGVSINDIIFIDSLNGFITHPYHIIRTTNGGTNWYVQVTDSSAFFRKVKFSSNTGYIICDLFLYKTTNGGNNWFTVPLPSAIQFSEDMSVLNKDTLFITQPGFGGALAKSTNGGNNWFPIYASTNTPDKIYYVDDRIGFFGVGTVLNKTTNGGYNFFQLNVDTYKDIHFLDTLRGWKTDLSGGTIRKTIDGGYNWISNALVPSGNYPEIIINISQINKFTLLNKDTLWGFGQSWLTYPNNTYAGFIQISTNGGVNWGFQIPDTSFNKFVYELGSFFNKNIGGVFDYTINGIHTNVGGSDTTYHIITDIKKETQNVIADKFTLYQNFPNPFNSISKIKYTIKNSVSSIQYSEIKLVVYDMLGKEITKLVNDKQKPGNYEVNFNAGNLSSGVYFYKMEIWDGKGNYAFDVKKMALLK